MHVSIVSRSFLASADDRTGVAPLVGRVHSLGSSPCRVASEILRFDDLDDAQTYLDRWERREPRPLPAPAAPAGT